MYYFLNFFPWGELVYGDLDNITLSVSVGNDGVNKKTNCLNECLAPTISYQSAFYILTCPESIFLPLPQRYTETRDVLMIFNFRHFTCNDAE